RWPQRCYYKRERNQEKGRSVHATARSQLAGLPETVGKSGIALLGTSCKHRDCEQRNALALLASEAAASRPRIPRSLLELQRYPSVQGGGSETTGEGGFRGRPPGRRPAVPPPLPGRFPGSKDGRRAAAPLPGYQPPHL